MSELQTQTEALFKEAEASSNDHVSTSQLQHRREQPSTLPRLETWLHPTMAHKSKKAPCSHACGWRCSGSLMRSFSSANPERKARLGLCPEAISFTNLHSAAQGNNTHANNTYGNFSTTVGWTAAATNRLPLVIRTMESFRTRLFYFHFARLCLCYHQCDEL